MRKSAAATVRDYLGKAVDRLELKDLDDNDLEKILENIQKAEKEIEKELDN